MPRYSIERKAAVLDKMLPPHNLSIPEVSNQRQKPILVGFQPQLVPNNANEMRAGNAVAARDISTSIVV